MGKILDISNLKIIFEMDDTFIEAVEGVDLFVNEGESVAIVGESGCGKSVTGLACMKLLASNAKLSADRFDLIARGVHDLRTETEKEMLSLREEEIAMVFQDPSSFLNPVMSIGEQMDEVFKYHKKLKPKACKAASIEMMHKVGIPDPEMRYKQFPHELSGGIKQRILIAIAMSCDPKLLIADEPTTALDVTIQAQILQLMKELMAKNGTALLMITHDLGVVKKMAQRVYVMYCGKIVEVGKTEEILFDPLHPYTKALIDTIPSISDEIKRFVQIPHNVPHPTAKPSGCYFQNRCAYCTELCKAHMPPLFDKGEGRASRCWFSAEELWKK